MRNILLLSTFLSVLIQQLFAEEDRKSFPDFWVVSSEKDPSLSDKEAVFEFEVMNEELRDTFTTVIASYNSSTFSFKPGTAGKHELKVAPGTYTFQFFKEVAEPFMNSYYEEIYSPETQIQPGYRTKVQLRFSYSEMQIISDKPVIYLYPQEDQPVSVTVAPKKDFTFTYPAYDNGWNGTAHPDGSMTINGKNYPYLFWESENVFRRDMIAAAEGFIVETENTVAFLEEQLTTMGLSDREQADFITYWGPRMTGNNLHYVHFLFNDEVDRFAELHIDPKPENCFRVYMVWWPVPEAFSYDVAPQVIQSVDRSGFYAIEWGGSEIPVEEKTFAKK